MLCAKYQQIYDGLVVALEQAVKDKRRMTASQAAKTLGYNAAHVAYMVRRLRTQNAMVLVQRYESLVAQASGCETTARRTPQTKPRQPSPLKIVRAQLKPERRVKYKTPVELYDAVQVKLLEMNGASEAFVCKVLQIDLEEYERAKAQVAALSVMAAVPVKAEVIPTKFHRMVPANDFEALQALLGFLQPISAETRKRVLCSAAAFYGVTL